MTNASGKQIESQHQHVLRHLRDMFHPATIEQLWQVMDGRVGKPSINRIVRRIVHKGLATAFIEREPMEFMCLAENKRGQKVRKRNTHESQQSGSDKRIQR